MTTRARIALLLCGSGFCALIYQVAWLRELRLVFGASTPANAAVLAVFMGGLGYGSLHLSKRADRADKPLGLYANLEVMIALTAAITPALLWAVRAGYVALGGTTSLGIVGGTLVRLIASALVLLPPTFLMGGTLPAAARAAMSDDDVGRRSTALLYGANTLGAVLGASLSTFLLMEVFGTQLTLWLGCTVNLLVAMIARSVDRGLPTLEVPKDTKRKKDKAAKLPRFVLAASCAVGFVFLLLELVWYRMLAPLLGGSTYTFGMILAVALLGVGIGGLLYTLRRSDTQPTLAAFATSCALEGVFVAIPIALGDRLAMFALMLRPFGSVGLWGHAFAWATVTAIVVLPAAIVAGYQFPLLIALLGKGREGVGRHVGLAYAWNTLGAIGGSLAGGFLVLPWLTAPGAWRLGVCGLALLAAAALYVYDREKGARKKAMLLPAGLVLLALAAVAIPDGPTEVWRHSPIGAGRVDFVTQYKTRNQLRRWMREQRYAVTWQVDGRESSIAMHSLVDTAFLVGGKSDGSAIVDCTTQVMSGMLGALLHGDVKNTMVIGLGTGSTAGWLGALPNVESVDVVEIEPAIVHVARFLTPVNAGVLDNPKVHLSDGDAREVLLTTPRRYDLVFSEPSNPYRAGIASLFTREFYEAVKLRLEPGGVFVQWVQGYEIDTESVRTVYTTLSSVFGSVSSWRTDVNDLVLIARASDAVVDVEQVRSLMATQPYKSALMNVWRVDSIEGLLAHHVAHPDMARSVSAAAGDLLINTDDRNLLEFAIARSLGRKSVFSVAGLRAVAAQRGFGRPKVNGDVDWERVADERMTIAMAHNGEPAPTDPNTLSVAARHRYQAYRAWADNRHELVLSNWGKVGDPVRTPLEFMVLAEAFASTGRPDAAGPLIERLRKRMPTEALAIEARAAFAANDHRLAFEKLQQTFTAYRTDPWPSSKLMLRTLRLVPALARTNPWMVGPLLDLLSQPFSTNALRVHRERYAVHVAIMLDDPAHCVAALARFEPNAPWERDFLEVRLQCYVRANSPLLDVARDELQLFIEDSGTPIAGGLLPGP